MVDRKTNEIDIAITVRTYNKSNGKRIVNKNRIFKENEYELYRNVFSNYVKWIPANMAQKVSSIRHIINVNASDAHNASKSRLL